MEVTNTSSSFADPLAINDDGGSSLVSEPEKYEHSNIDQVSEQPTFQSVISPL